MPLIDRIADFDPELRRWRQDLHAHPELMFDVHRTAQFVSDKLKAFGCDEVVTGIGLTGVVGVIEGRRAGGDSRQTLGLRADMDALPIDEQTNAPYRSTIPGMMHACGHDGHTTMLLGAARYLAETRDFSGRVAVIFQPAEEGGGGGQVMIEDGLMDRFDIGEVYGLHNLPGLPVGQFGIRSGPIMAATDTVLISIHGKGGHAARPHTAVDPILIGAHLITQFQSIVARNVDPLGAAVVSICEFHAGDATNVIPQNAELAGTVRTFSDSIRATIKERLQAIVDGTAAAFGAEIVLQYKPGYPVLSNHPEQTELAAAAAAVVVGADKVDRDAAPLMAAEDFAFMLNARPGAYIFMGNGDSAGLHHPAYDFNDEALVHGASYWARLVEQRLR